MTPKKLLLGAGTHCRSDYINLDINKHQGIDVVHDLNVFPYPFQDNQFELVEAHHVIEHLEDIPSVIKEIARILKPGGRMLLTVPHFSASCAFKDSTHRHYFAYVTFKYFQKGWYENKIYNYPFQFFNKVDVKINFHKGFLIHNYFVEPLINWVVKFNEGDLYENSFLRSFFPPYTLTVNAVK